MTFVSDLEPKALWQHFDKILTIPRGSKNEQAVADYVLSVADKHDLHYKQDDTGNLVVRKPASAGHETAAITVLQSHLDMVNEKNADVQHDFSKDAITPRQEGDYLYAAGTTLGSDNGIGLAAELALMESTEVEHGPLELLFTVDEETGLTGAQNLSDELLEGRRLINLDTEEAGALYVGCAGGAGVNITVPLAFSSPSDKMQGIEIKVSGLKGGHSGMDIHRQRGNAVKLLARALNSVAREVDFEVIRISGGNMRNAIPREAFAAVAVLPELRDEFQETLDENVKVIRDEIQAADPDIEVSFSAVDAVDQVLDSKTCDRVLHLLDALPHGVISMSYDIPDLVETSANLATVNMDNGVMRIHVSNRSSVPSAMRAIQQRIGSMAKLADGQVEEVEGYPGWTPNLDSPLLKVAVDVHRSIFGKPPKVKAIHAGLECGIIGQKYPDMEMVSLGPQIEFPHSPGERVKISSVADFYRLLVGVIERLAKP